MCNFSKNIGEKRIKHFIDFPSKSVLCPYQFSIRTDLRDKNPKILRTRSTIKCNVQLHFTKDKYYLHKYMYL